ncbi:hypothetical protein IEZ26_02995 [Nocardioides cavernae]|uniref:Uncharacterized protein n=1 Tax=Nocardioides cavernae TaxID=1921566 RepID=A0ABR8N5Z3_9ACTN|nr:hypothetical protein [Nocardioides cavernae]MBD3923573.1 hypothetical protein [Nocardioides cavernae]MBM7511498.1 hypothetical protein [Nocardioides cavernae]
MPLFGRSKDDAPPLLVDVHLAARVQPVHRGEIYEEPLQAAFDQFLPGSKVVGGGSQLDPTQGVLSCDLEVELCGDRDKGLDVLVKVLEHYGAPVGSSYTVGDEATVPFGRTHGVALSLDGTSLPAEVYATNDVNELIGALTTELGEVATLQSWWEGPQRTNLYFYGNDAAQIRDVLSSAASRFPLAQSSLVEDIA